MPRFEISSLSSPSDNLDVLRARSSSSSGGVRKSVNLSCPSPNGRGSFSLSFSEEQGYYIEYQNLVALSDEEGENNGVPSSARCSVPLNVETALEISPPVELLCVEADSPKKVKAVDEGHNPGTSRRESYCLCVYTKRNAFLVEFSLPSLGSEGEGDAVGTGAEIVSATEPFESHLLSVQSTTNIVRVRSAPQRRMGYATLCPRGSMAMLTHDPVVNEYALVLHHGSKSLLTTPLRFGTENLLEGEERVTDFCFAQSNGLSLLSSCTVLLLKGSGDVHAASPVLFDDSVVSRVALDESFDYLNEELESSANNPCLWRQFRAAQQFFRDAFVIGDGVSHFVTARLLGTGRHDSAATWPVKLRGPVMLASSVADPGRHADTVETFYAPELAGFVVGWGCTNIDFGLVSPTSFVPRFDFESPKDSFALEEAYPGVQAVHRMSLLRESETSKPLASSDSFALLRDPVVDSMLHLVSSGGVTTISTNVMRVTISKILAQAKDASGEASSPSVRRTGSSTDAVRTAIWSSINVSSDSGIRLTGAIASGDSQLGHMLVGRLSNGSTVPVNVTESRCLHEVFNVKNEKKDQLAITSGANLPNEALKTLEATPPLYELVEPLVNKVRKGLSGMGKIVGSDTLQKDITPDKLAVAMRVKERCDKEVVLPLLELQHHVRARREILATILREQMEQLESLKEMVANLKERKKSISEKMELAQSNASALAHRSDSVLQASQDLLPTITQAESEYFQQLKHLERKCDMWEEKFNELDGRSSSTCASLLDNSRTCALDLDPGQAAQCYDLLKGQEDELKKAKIRLTAAEQKIKQATRDCGLEISSGTLSSEDQ